MKLRRIAAAAGLAAPAPGALAHTTIEGIGNFTNGLLHPAVVPAHALLLVALGLLLGQQGTDHVRRALPAFALLLALGLLLSSQATPPPQSVLLAAAVVTGLLLAAALPLPGLLTLSLAAVAGALVGFDSDTEGQSGSARLTTLAGIWMAASFAVLWFFGIADTLRRAWQKIAVRVAGSWIAAIAVMVLALNLAN